MKRVGNLWSNICSKDNLQLAHKNARSNKGWYAEVKAVDQEPEKYIEALKQMFERKTYHTSKYEVFYKQEKDKIRTLYKLPYFPDRVAQWAVIQVIEPYVLKTFTNDTYSAIKGRGIKSATLNLRKAVYTDFDNFKYCLKIDIRHYYQSIDHEILKSKYARLFKDTDLLWFLDEVIDSINTADDEDLIRLNSQGRNVGIPIGNYLSQISGNLYLSDFDHWVKEECKVKYYYRYMDDMVFSGATKEELFDLLAKIQEKLQKDFRLTIKDNWQIFPVDIRGIDFVGYRVFEEYTLLRRYTADNFKHKLNTLKKKTKIKDSDFCSFYSYTGYLKWCNNYQFIRRYVISVLPKIGAYCRQRRDSA